MSGAIRIDWQTIKTRYASNLVDAYLVVVPRVFASLVLAIQERLHWRATYRIDGYDYADWDELQAIIDTGLAGLTDGIMLQELLDNTDGLETLLTQILEKPCCDTSTVTEIITDGDGIPIPPGDEGDDFEVGVGDAPAGTDWATTYPPELCANAQAFVDSLDNWVLGVQTARDLVIGGVMAVAAAAVAVVASQLVAVGLVTTTVAGALGAGIRVVQAIAAIRDLFTLDESEYTAAIAELAQQSVKDELVCAIIGANTPAAAEMALDAAMVEHAPNASSFVSALPLRFFLASAMRLELDGSGYAGCPDCDEPPVASGLRLGDYSALLDGDFDSDENPTGWKDLTGDVHTFNYYERYRFRPSGGSGRFGFRVLDPAGPTNVNIGMDLIEKVGGAANPADPSFSVNNVAAVDLCGSGTVAGCIGTYAAAHGMGMGLGNDAYWSGSYIVVEFSP